MANPKNPKNTQPVPPPKTRKSTVAVKYYLLAYNVLSALAWSYILILILAHLLTMKKIPPQTLANTPKTALSRIISFLPFAKSSNNTPPLTVESRLPPYLQPLYRRSTTTYSRIGLQLAFIQTFAALEVVHVLLKLVGSPIKTTAMQVASRLFLVWGIAEQFHVARSNPLYTTMVLAWSTTEVIRYSFYATSLIGLDSYPLLFLRYTAFYVLYPLGAGSEALLIYSTLPGSYPPIPGSKQSLQGVWKFTDYLRALLFAVWWPGLYVMYTYMMQQRHKIFANGNGRTLESKSKTR